jgi:hypothetical protein
MTSRDVLYVGRESLHVERLTPFTLQMLLDFNSCDEIHSLARRIDTYQRCLLVCDIAEHRLFIAAHLTITESRLMELTAPQRGFDSAIGLQTKG